MNEEKNSSQGFASDFISVFGLTYDFPGSSRKLSSGSIINISGEELEVKSVFCATSMVSDKTFFLAKLEDDSFILVSSYDDNTAISRISKFALLSLYRMLGVAVETSSDLGSKPLDNHKILFDI